MLLVGLSAAAVPAVAWAQQAPASDIAIRVIEQHDRHSGSVVRRLVGELLFDEVLAIQDALTRAGFAPVVRSGRLDGGTRRALLRFQRSRGLRRCGCPTYETILALGLRIVIDRPGHRSIGRVVVRAGRRHATGARRGVVGGGVFVGLPPVRGSSGERAIKHRSRIRHHKPAVRTGGRARGAGPPSAIRPGRRAIAPR